MYYGANSTGSIKSLHFLLFTYLYLFLQVKLDMALTYRGTVILNEDTPDDSPA